VIDLAKVPLIESENQTPNPPRRTVDLVVLHSTEGKEYRGSARNVADWFQDDRCHASAHYVVDPGEVVQCVPDVAVAWHAYGCNARGIGVEMCGLAEQTVAQWADPDSLAIIARTADLVAAICLKWQIPATGMAISQNTGWQWVLQNQKGRGLLTHAQASAAFPGHGNHWDPGPNFPWAAFVEKVARLLEGTR